MAAKHELLLQQTFLLIQKKYPLARIFPRHVGTFFKHNGAPIKINMKGMADAYLLLPHNGELFHIEIEFKHGSDKQRTDQIQWQKTIESMNGLYILARQPSDVITAIKNKWPDIN